jgi:hypothetical protein
VPTDGKSPDVAVVWDEIILGCAGEQVAEDAHGVPDAERLGDRGREHPGVHGQLASIEAVDTDHGPDPTFVQPAANWKRPERTLRPPERVLVAGNLELEPPSHVQLERAVGVTCR